MKRPGLLLTSGLVLGLLTGWCAYFSRTAPHRAMRESEQPELAWLQHEFKLSHDEFARVETLHEAYLPKCAEMCMRIDAASKLIREQISKQGGMTREIETLLDEAARLRAQCQKQMLEHFFEVSRAMPRDQGERYLSWVQERVFSMGVHEPPGRSESTHDHGR